jgi:A/G-specific adenine glycosylase
MRHRAQKQGTRRDFSIGEGEHQGFECGVHRGLLRRWLGKWETVCTEYSELRQAVALPRLGKRREMASMGVMLKPRCDVELLEERPAFRQALGRWFARNARDYPWRRTRDPYAVLVSEVMLQQTQIATVLGKGYFTRFLEKFPDLETLAAAEDAALLKAWEGLGYYRRARMLRETARAVCLRHGAKFPAETDALLELPGIGRYTAGALRAFAFGLPAVVVDGNVSRVLARLMDFRKPVDAGEGSRQVWAWAAELADDAHPSVHHAAMMELGQTHCRPGVPECAGCPVARFCATRHPESLPLKRGRPAITAVDEHALWLRDARGRLLMHREAGNRRTGLWKLPLRDPAEIGRLPVLAELGYSITRYRVTLRVHDARAGGQRCRKPVAGDEWIEPESLLGLAMAAPFRRVVERLLEDF